MTLLLPTQQPPQLKTTPFDKAFRCHVGNGDAYAEGYRWGWEACRVDWHTFKVTVRYEALVAGYADGQSDRLWVATENHPLLYRAMTEQKVDLQLEASLLTVKRLP